MNAVQVGVPSTEMSCTCSHGWGWHRMRCDLAGRRTFASAAPPCPSFAGPLTQVGVVVLQDAEEDLAQQRVVVPHHGPQGCPTRHVDEVAHHGGAHRSSKGGVSYHSGSPRRLRRAALWPVWERWSGACVAARSAEQNLQCLHHCVPTARRPKHRLGVGGPARGPVRSGFFRQDDVSRPPAHIQFRL